MTQLNMLPADMQRANEYRYSPRHIDRHIRLEITDNPDNHAKVHHGVELLEQWLETEFYDSKNKRLAQLKGLDLYELVMSIFTGVTYCYEPTLFASLTSQMAGRLKFDDKRDAIITVAEMVALLADTDAYDIGQVAKGTSYLIVNRLPLSEKLISYIEGCRYMPPMVCEPAEVTHNYQNGYLTFSSSLVLGNTANHHDGDLCLDVINTQNKVALKLDLEFLCTVEEEANKPLDQVKNMEKKNSAQIAMEIQQKKDNWDRFKRESYQFYTMLAKQGNRFWLTHKVDTRGRLYAQGYHISTQGSGFKKAMLELANEEVVTGVPGL